MAQILDLDGVNLQGASRQEPQPEEGEQENPVGALPGQAASHRGWEGDKCHCSHMQLLPTELV